MYFIINKIDCILKCYYNSIYTNTNYLTLIAHFPELHFLEFGILRFYDLAPPPVLNLYFYCLFFELRLLIKPLVTSSFSIWYIYMRIPEWVNRRGNSRIGIRHQKYFNIKVKCLPSDATVWAELLSSWTWCRIYVWHISCHIFKINCII